MQRSTSATSRCSTVAHPGPIAALEEEILRIETGKGVGGQLIDLQASDIIEQRITPRLREGRYHDAIGDGSDAIAAALGSTQPPATQNVPTYAPFAFIAVFILFVLLRFFFFRGRPFFFWGGPRGGFGGGGGGRRLFGRRWTVGRRRRERKLVCILFGGVLAGARSPRIIRR